MSAVVANQHNDRMRRRNIRVAVGFGVVAFVFYISLYVIYLTAAH